MATSYLEALGDASFFIRCKVDYVVYDMKIGAMILVFSGQRLYLPSWGSTKLHITWDGHSLTVQLTISLSNARQMMI